MCNPMESVALKMMFDQILDGRDIPVVGSMLRMTAKRAGECKEGLPYTLTDNLWHVVYWQELWLQELRGEKTPPMMQVWSGDWKGAEEYQFGELREKLLEGLEEARLMCKGELAVERGELLMRIGIHAAYHIGQLNLIKRIKE
jgi:uncharacterized damage-inducible protein DinB